MAQTEVVANSPGSAPKRPRGILKNSSSYQNQSPEAITSPSVQAQQSIHSASGNDHAALPSPGLPSQQANARPGMPHREMSEKEIVQMNTELNAGPHRRTSSNPRSSVSGRRGSSNGHSDDARMATDESGQRLKWDEANLYLNEGQMGGRMKIDEPKTPFVHNADAIAVTEDDDDADVSTIDTSQVNVDELEMGKSSAELRSRKTSNKNNDIPGLDLGEPELDAEMKRSDSEGDKRVMVDQDSMDVDGGKHDPETDNATRAEKEKHAKFEQMRRKHYEMKNVKDLLGHSAEDMDETDDA